MYHSEDYLDAIYCNVESKMYESHLSSIQMLFDQI